MNRPYHPAERAGFRRRVFLLVFLFLAVNATALGLGFSQRASREQLPPPPPSLSVAPATPAPTPTPTPTLTPTPPLYDFSQPAPEREEVDGDYFSDAIFLGDSRTDGLRIYSGIRGADFIAYRSLMVFHATGGLDTEIVKVPLNAVGEKLTVWEAVQAKDYKKIYVMFGVNELAIEDDDAFVLAYTQLIGSLRELCPDAVIYIQALIPLNDAEAHVTNPNPLVSNQQILVYNDLLRQVAEETQVPYLNVWEEFADETGQLPAEDTHDGIHLSREGYGRWYQYLKTHTVTWEEFSSGSPPEDLPTVELGGDGG